MNTGKKPIKSYLKQTEAGADEQRIRAAEQRTQGRMGCKMPRINMAFTPENHDYIRTMAAVRGETITTWTNRVIAEHRESHAEIYEHAKEISRQIDIIKENT